MKCTNLVFPAPKPEYTEKSFEIIWIPKASSSKQKKNIPVAYVSPPESHKSIKILIYFHGNAEDLEFAHDFILRFSKEFFIHGVAVEYPGYGIYKGTPSEKLIYEDAIAVHDYFAQKGFDEENIFLLGRSLGSSPAIYLASKRKVGALILISPFQSVKKLAKDLVGIFSILVKDYFKNEDHIRSVTCPTLFLHGEKDDLVPYLHSLNLYYSCPAKKEIVIQKKMTHNAFRLYADIFLPISDFLRKYKVLATLNKSFIDVKVGEDNEKSITKNDNK